ncbi:MAG TPA: deoxyribonuclease IV [Gemmatimonadales bacterium]|nr:deoxyribonuclease IV [Gemmatimonadales bacterium]
MHRPDQPERLGAHVSVQGGVETAPVRGKVIGATAIQVFTKTPSQWREPGISSESYDAFRRECERCEVSNIVGHDSYLINLASPDPALTARSEAAFVAELRRCKAFGIPYLVSHPGNYIDDRDAGLVRNAAAYTRCLRLVPESPVVLLETTAGCGTSLGSTFQELAMLRAAIADDVRPRIAYCADTCHLYSAGHDLVGDYDGVWRAWDEILGLDNLLCLHLNDSKTKFASRRDRHELIGEGSLGPQPFRRIMTDPRLVRAIKILETPKGDDGVTADRKMLRRLRRYARAVGPPR